MDRFSYIVMDRLSALRENDLRPILHSLADCGYKGVEFNLTEPAGLPLDRLQQLVSEYSLQVPSFLTGEAYFDGLCLSSPRAEVRRHTVERLIRYFDAALRFEAILVVGLLQGTRRDEQDSNAANTRIEEGLRIVAGEADRRGVQIVIEPVNHLQVGFHNSVGEVLQLVKRIGSPSIRPMVDTIHMNIEETSLTEPIHACGTSLRHVHLCESNGGRFGSGNVDFRSVLAALDAIAYPHFCSIKVYRHLSPPEGARTSLEHLRSL